MGVHPRRSVVFVKKSQCSTWNIGFFLLFYVCFCLLNHSCAEKNKMVYYIINISRRKKQMIESWDVVL